LLLLLLKDIRPQQAEMQQKLRAFLKRLPAAGEATSWTAFERRLDGLDEQIRRIERRLGIEA
jgi:hypothetical protein